jgi:hypothetical protein
MTVVACRLRLVHVVFRTTLTGSFSFEAPNADSFAGPGSGIPKNVST